MTKRPPMPWRIGPEKPVKCYFAVIRLSHGLVNLAKPCVISHALALSEEHHRLREGEISQDLSPRRDKPMILKNRYCWALAGLVALTTSAALADDQPLDQQLLRYAKSDLHGWFPELRHLYKQGILGLERLSWIDPYRW